MDDPEITTRIAKAADIKYVYPILYEMERSARARGTGISKRSPQSLCRKILEGKAAIAMTKSDEWAGFSYIDIWGNGEFVSNSGLIVNPCYRGTGVATAIKQLIFTLSRIRFPDAKIFSITTGAAVLRLNYHLGFEPATFSEITTDKAFWDQCKTCVNYPVLESKARKMCFCMAMVFYPEKKAVVQKRNVPCLKKEMAVTDHRFRTLPPRSL